MSTVDELLETSTDLSPEAIDHLRRLLGEWQILADLSFADLLLFVHDTAGERPGYLCVGHMRPYTAQTIYTEDLVGERFPLLERPMVGRAFAERRVIRDTDPDWSTGVPVREEAIPVAFRGDVIAVITREANVSTARSPSQLELTYLQAAGELIRMVADGTFPYVRGGAPEDHEISPRVGDGVMRAGPDRTITYASPNAVSAYRRLGCNTRLVGEALEAIDPEPGAVLHALANQVSVVSEIEHDGATVLRRVLPLIRSDEVCGTLVLIRDVSELRRHQRALRVKDATIREIHHRVKNNLQTVASLLRLQARRLASEEGREALAESVRRISSIALVHETLSREAGQRVAFAEVAQRIVDMLRDGIVNPDRPVSFVLEGDAGDIPDDIATPLALVLTELMQNTIEHAFSERGGTVTIAFERKPASLAVQVTDDGVGLPEGASLQQIANLGLQIASTLVTSELGGTLDLAPAQPGTTFRLVIPIP